LHFHHFVTIHVLTLAVKHAIVKVEWNRSIVKENAMAYVTQAIRRKLADEAHEARHPERVVERVNFRAAADKALSETRAKFPVLTPDNFEAANEYRERRIRELMEH